MIAKEVLASRNGFKHRHWELVLVLEWNLAAWPVIRDRACEALALLRALE